jgi:hypothetical protein
MSIVAYAGNRAGGYHAGRMSVKIVHPVDVGVVLNPVDQWSCPPDGFLFGVEGVTEGMAGLLVRSMYVIEAAPALRWAVGKQWLNEVVPRLLKQGARVRLLKEAPHRRIEGIRGHAPIARFN